MSIFCAIMRTAVCNGKIYASDYLKLCHKTFTVYIRYSTNTSEWQYVHM